MRILWIFAAITLAGCSAYQPAGVFDGYSETRLSANSFKVSATAASEGTTRQVLMLRAAELTLQNGYQKFQVTGQSVKMEQREDVLAPAPVVQHQVDPWGHISVVHTMAPPSTEVYSVAKGEMTIRMFKNGDPGATKAEDAAAVRARLEPLLKG